MIADKSMQTDRTIMYKSNEYKFIGKVSEIFKKKIKTITENKKVLDVGCGDGVYLKEFREDSLGVDISPNNLNYSFERKRRVQEINLNEPQAINEKFDVVYCSGVIEHVENPIRLLRFMHNQLIDEGGQLIISFPNEDSIIHFIHPYFTRDGNHLYSFSIDNMLELLKYTNFKNPKIMYEVETSLGEKYKFNWFFFFLRSLGIEFINNKISWNFWIIVDK